VTSFIPIYDRTKVMVGQAQMYIGPYSSTSPLALPADSVALGGGWPVGWVAAGATEEGVTLAVSRETEDIMIEEQMTPVSVNTTSMNIRVETVLSEDTLEVWKLAFGGGTIVTTAASSGVIGKKTLTIASDLDNLTLGMEAKNEFGFFRRMLVPLVVSIADVEIQYRRAQNAHRLATSFRCLVKPEDIVIRDKTANALP
jgi:hypothetical protein